MKIAFGVGVTAFSVFALLAGSAAAETPVGAPETKFIDLTGANTAPASGAPQTMFMDLTKDSVTAVPMPPPSDAGPAMRRRVDLTTGTMEEAEINVAPAPIEGIVITADRDKEADPWEDTNRDRFHAHVRLHRYVIDPVERAYIFVVPEPARMGIHNFMTNLETPVVLANDLFQGRIGGAGTTLSRFVVNSTVGVGGIFDFASRAGLPYHDNDFGATLANYGVGDYPYLLVPVIGPSNPRDLGGKVVDIFLDPLHFVALPGGILTSVGKSGVHEVDKRSYDVGQLDQLDRTSPDAYAEERAQARAKRNAEINGTDQDEH